MVIMVFYNWKEITWLHLYLKKVRTKSTDMSMSEIKALLAPVENKILLSIKKELDQSLNKNIGYIQWRSREINICRKLPIPNRQCKNSSLIRRPIADFVIVILTVQIQCLQLSVTTKLLPKQTLLARSPFPSSFQILQDGVENWSHKRWKSKVEIRKIYWKQ